jgi:ribosomal protein L11 methyltransferase
MTTPNTPHDALTPQDPTAADLDAEAAANAAAEAAAHDTTTSPWLRVSIETDDHPLLLELLTEILDEWGAACVEQQDHTTLPSTLDVPLPAGRARLVTYMDNLDTERLGYLREHIGLQARVLERSLIFSAAPFDDTSWRDAWKAFFKPAQVSPRLAIRAPWTSFDPLPDVEVLIIEPGMAFGTGLHETTRLCLQAIDRYAPAASVLDVGCGSGVLGIAAARLGAQKVLCFDNDPIATDVTIENAAVNSVSALVEARTATLDLIDGQWHLVIANILSGVLRAIRDDLVAHTLPGGVLALSGILSSEAPALLEDFMLNPDLTYIQTVTMGEWVCIELRRKPL